MVTDECLCIHRWERHSWMFPFPGKHYQSSQCFRFFFSFHAQTHLSTQFALCKWVAVDISAHIYTLFTDVDQNWNLRKPVSFQFHFHRRESKMMSHCCCCLLRFTASLTGWQSGSGHANSRLKQKTSGGETIGKWNLMRRLYPTLQNRAGSSTSGKQVHGQFDSQYI